MRSVSVEGRFFLNFFNECRTAGDVRSVAVSQNDHGVGINDEGVARVALGIEACVVSAEGLTVTGDVAGLTPVDQIIA